MIPVFLSAGEVVLFQTSDLHGSVFPAGERAGAPAVLSALSGDAERTGREKSLLIDCGDLLQGTLESAADQGKNMIRFLNAAGYDVWVPGNHDFEFGPAALSERIHEFKGSVLAANIRYPGILSWKIFERNGYRIAVIGLTNPHLDKWLFHPEKVGFPVISVEPVLKKTLPGILRKKPDAIILAIHSGLYPSKRLNDPGMFALARKFPELTVILGGHTHEKVICKELGRSGVCYFQADSHGSGYIKVKLHFKDKKGNIDVSGEYIHVSPEQKPGPEFVQEKMKMPGDRYRFPVKAPPRETAKVFAEAIYNAFPEAKIVFHGALTKYQVKKSPVNLFQLFLICPYENMALLAYLNRKEFNQIVQEQKLSGKYGMFQEYFFFPDGKTPFSGDPEQRVLTIFNSFAASSAGGRFPVLNHIVNKEEVRAVLTDKKIFDLLKNYTKEK